MESYQIRLNRDKIERRKKNAEVPKRITIAPHLGEEELYQRYRQSQDVIQKTHYQTIWLLTQGKRLKEVAQITGDSPN